MNSYTIKSKRSKEEIKITHPNIIYNIFKGMFFLFTKTLFLLLPIFILCTKYEGKCLS